MKRNVIKDGEENLQTLTQTDELALLVITFYYQPTFRPPIQVGFFRAMFSTTKHAAYQ